MIIKFITQTDLGAMFSGICKNLWSRGLKEIHKYKFKGYGRTVFWSFYSYGITLNLRRR